VSLTRTESLLAERKEVSGMLLALSMLKGC